ncbi:peptide MFS transporter [Rufibacter sediminis]|uniref:Peptide MFS transporter n=1 Tax=Rufibacter sediminis TaxID=2762756 RepID=A0ABR6VX40_9BACT|nr:peptide MFS transporter [Rufibacter sediminis]MBC3541709.1 peptide MFS transporter [Rufibacter sediminis]
MSQGVHPLNDQVSKHNIPYGEQPLGTDGAHPPGLFVLFFTEMWERFSYYGMRALFVLFLTSTVANGGWAWEREEALQLYGIYTGLVYLTPIIGGYIADRFLGFRNAIIFGALLMTLGHASMALESVTFFYIGLGLIILGNGLFKPNISSMVGQLYVKNPAKKDAAYTIFYMGINSGAFLGILLCGYIGEKVGWSWGFGLAGIFMLFGMLQFMFSKRLFGNIGLSPKNQLESGSAAAAKAEEAPAHIVRDRLIVISVLAFFVIFFWMAFEQAGGSMTIFAADYTNRVLEGSSGIIFKWANAILVVVPMLILTVVLGNLFRQTYKHIPFSNLFLGLSFVIIWGIIIWMLRREFISDATEVPASWFQILNSFFIISCAPIFSKIWESKYNPSAPVKFALGLFLLGIGFGILAYGGLSIPQGAKTASVSMVWLILAYLFHTLGELCISPVGLSYVSKLSPQRLVGLMFGIWFVANFVANTLAGWTGSYIDKITETYSISTFFLIFTALPVLAGLIMLALNGTLKKKMHGIQ